VSGGRQRLAVGWFRPHAARMVGRTRTRTLGVAALVTATILTPIGATAQAAPAGPTDPARPVLTGLNVEVDGYVWANEPTTASYSISHSWRYNSTGADVEISRTSAGIYRVAFVGMAGTGGVAHARPYGSANTAICTVANWAPSGSDQIVNVRCFDEDGTPADTRFVASFTNRTAPAGTFAFLWADQKSPAIDVPYTPNGTYAYDSTGAGPQVWRQSTGVYMMLIPTVDTHYPVDHNDGVYQVSAYGRDPVRCEVHGENDETPTPIAVFCVDPDGTPTDSRFAVTYAHSRSVLGTAVSAGNAHPRHTVNDVTDWYLTGFWNPGGAPAIVRLGIGRYHVSFPGLALTGGHATAGSRGNPFAYCHVASWSPGAATVNCFDSTTDAPVDSEFNVLMTD
jgi:hypothetical protein